MLDKQHGAPYNLCKKCVMLAIYIILFLLPPQAENHNYNHRKKRRLNDVCVRFSGCSKEDSTSNSEDDAADVQMWA